MLALTINLVLVGKFRDLVAMATPSAALDCERSLIF